jgi:hypothetical protein
MAVQGDSCEEDAGGNRATNLDEFGKGEVNSLKNEAFYTFFKVINLYGT